MSHGEPCMCGATDCPSCGRAQGYRVEWSPTRGYYNPEPDDEEEADIAPIQAEECDE